RTLSLFSSHCRSPKCMYQEILTARHGETFSNKINICQRDCQVNGLQNGLLSEHRAILFEYESGTEKYPTARYTPILIQATQLRLLRSPILIQATQLRLLHSPILVQTINLRALLQVTKLHQ
ncbi:hypothetical protein J6590_020415, partial [Homalodisca vitripennis]